MRTNIDPPSTSRAIHPLTIPDDKPRVFVVDSDVSAYESLKRLIESEGWEAETYAEAADILSRPRGAVPCCLLLDITCPGLSGVDVQRQLARRTGMPIIVIGGYDMRASVEAMKAGALDFLTKPLQTEALLSAIRQALDCSRVALLHESEMQPLRTCYASLTRRERAVMALVVSGLPNKQIGGELDISETTVKAHRGQVMRKMKAGSLPELVTMAARLGVPSATAH